MLPASPLFSGVPYSILEYTPSRDWQQTNPAIELARVQSVEILLNKQRTWNKKNIPGTQETRDTMAGRYTRRVPYNISQ